MVNFLVGLVLGCSLGFVMAALLGAGKDDRCDEVEGEE